MLTALNFPIVGEHPHAGSKAFRIALDKATSAEERAAVVADSWRTRKFWCLTLRVYDLLMRPSLRHRPGTHARLIIDTHPNPRHASAGPTAVKEWDKVKLGHHQLERHTKLFQERFGGCHLFVQSRMLFHVLDTVAVWTNGVTVPSGLGAKTQGRVAGPGAAAAAAGGGGGGGAAAGAAAATTDYTLVSDHPSSTRASALRRMYTALLQCRLTSNASEALEAAFAARGTVMPAVLATFNGKRTRLMRDVRSGALPLPALKLMAEAEFGVVLGQAVYMTIAFVAAQTFRTGGGGAWGRAGPAGTGGAARRPPEAEAWQCKDPECTTMVRGLHNLCGEHGGGTRR